MADAVIGTVILRAARDGDLDAILTITNDAIAHSDAIWAISPMTRDQRAAWFADRTKAGLPVLVATDTADTVLGFGSYGPFRLYEGYRRTIEHSVYVAADARGRGIGRMLLDALIAEATAQGFHIMIGAITADNAPSIALHRAAGFTESAVLPQVGQKFGRWLDLLLMYRLLDQSQPEPHQP
jgi:L-amino acid N-acyltransferase